MSRTRKNPPPRSFRGRVLNLCPRHGYCSWCDRNRQHQLLAAREHTDRDLKEALVQDDD